MHANVSRMATDHSHFPCMESTGQSKLHRSSHREWSFYDWPSDMSNTRYHNGRQSYFWYKCGENNINPHHIWSDKPAIDWVAASRTKTQLWHTKCRSAFQDYKHCGGINAQVYIATAPQQSTTLDDTFVMQCTKSKEDSTQSPLFSYMATPSALLAAPLACSNYNKNVILMQSQMLNLRTVPNF